MRTPFVRFAATLLAVASALVAGGEAFGKSLAVPALDSGDGWQLAEGCRVYRLGTRTDPDCDVLSGPGVAVQVNRIRLLDLPAGQDDRTTVGIAIRAEQDHWQFSTPYVALVVGGTSFAPSVIDEALVFEKAGRRIAPQRLPPNRSRYPLPAGEQRFFRFRFALPQRDLAGGFVLQITGLQRDGQAVSVPALAFRFP